jgi:hypothetical protein
MNLTKNELRSLVLEELEEMEELDEGFLDRMRMKFAGGKAKGKAYLQNLKRMGQRAGGNIGGAPGALPAAGQEGGGGPVNVKRAGALAGANKKLEIFQKKLESMYEDLFKDLEHFADITNNPDVHKHSKDLGKQIKAAGTAAKNLQRFIGMLDKDKPEEELPQKEE